MSRYVIRLKVHYCWKPSPQYEIAGVSWAMFEDCACDVDHEDCLNVEPFWVVAGENSLVAAIGYVSGEKHQFLIDTAAVVVFCQ